MAPDPFESAIARGAIEFGVLRALSLRHFHFQPSWMSAATALNASKLQSLTLRDCPHQMAFLDCLAQLKQALSLKNFELRFDGIQELDILSEAHPLIRFLFSFRGLEKLHLLISNSLGSAIDLYRATTHHRATLQTLVYHERHLALVDNEGIFEEARDVAVPWVLNTAFILKECQIRSLGLSLSAALAVGNYSNISDSSFFAFLWSAANFQH